ncbi:MAG: DUF481 domain-containing protein [Pirellulales bacterium]|nr:DUF481 domain-containing protein [Pirellulales bacterium]
MGKRLLWAIAGLSVSMAAAGAQELYGPPLPWQSDSPFVRTEFAAPGSLRPAPVPLPPITAESDVQREALPEPIALPAEIVASEELPPPVKLWEGSLELGLNGTEGNSQTFNFRFGAKLKRKTEKNSLSADTDYRRDSADSQETANRAFLDPRYEHFLGESPWSWFLHGTLEYDEFQAFDLRVAMDSGLGYSFLKNDTTTLVARLGAGTSREIGGPDDRFLPEAVFGTDLEHKIGRRHKLCFSAEYRPDVTDWADYRLTSKAGWEVLLDEAMNLSMKFTVSDRYDSTPHGLKPNDLDYAVMLLWSF